MNNTSCTILWNGKAVGTLSNITNDMWYLDAEWRSIPSDESTDFESIASALQPKEVMVNFEKGIPAIVKYNDTSLSPMHVLILSLSKDSIYMRMISEDVAVYLSQQLPIPWESVNNPTFFEKQLRKEISFFSYLHWKKVRAIGKRIDCDDVLFEISNGKFQYAIVHLTYSKVRSQKFPRIFFFTSWQDVYINRISKDHQDWEN